MSENSSLLSKRKKKRLLQTLIWDWQVSIKEHLVGKLYIKIRTWRNEIVIVIWSRAQNQAIFTVGRWRIHDAHTIIDDPETKRHSLDWEKSLLLNCKICNHDPLIDDPSCRYRYQIYLCIYSVYQNTMLVQNIPFGQKMKNINLYIYIYSGFIISKISQPPQTSRKQIHFK